MMEIGLFQLENLSLTRTQFCLLDLREERSPINASIDALLSKAAPSTPGQIEEKLQALRIDKGFPVVLICADGKISEKTARKLESSGYENIYVVARGIDGLLSEL